MQSEISVLKAEIQRFQSMADECADVIKNLTGFPADTPITISLSIKELRLSTLTLAESGVGNFVVSFFMSWHSFYSREIEHKRKILAALEAQYPIAC